MRESNESRASSQQPARQDACSGFLSGRLDRAAHALFSYSLLLRSIFLWLVRRSATCAYRMDGGWMMCDIFVVPVLLSFFLSFCNIVLLRCGTWWTRGSRGGASVEYTRAKTWRTPWRGYPRIAVAQVSTKRGARFTASARAVQSERTETRFAVLYSPVHLYHFHSWPAPVPWRAGRRAGATCW